MRTTLEISEQLINEAMRITGAKTKSQMIREALERLIMSDKRKRLINYAGKIDLDISLDELRDRK